MSIWRDSFTNSRLQFLHCKKVSPKHDLRKKTNTHDLRHKIETAMFQSPIIFYIITFSLIIMFTLLLKLMVGVSATEDTIQHIEAII